MHEALRGRVESESSDLVELTHIANDSSYIALLEKHFSQTIEAFTNLSLRESMKFPEHFEGLKS